MKLNVNHNCLALDYLSQSHWAHLSKREPYSITKWTVLCEMPSASLYVVKN